ncbi:MAG: hypothetical protein AAGF12_42765, partial [Myxococcota bacterium]
TAPSWPPVPLHIRRAAQDDVAEAAENPEAAENGEARENTEDAPAEALLTLVWPAANDAGVVAEYRIFRGDAVIATADGDARAHQLTVPNEDAEFSIVAVDTASNESVRLTKAYRVDSAIEFAEGESVPLTAEEALAQAEAGERLRQAFSRQGDSLARALSGTGRESALPAEAINPLQQLRPELLRRLQKLETPPLTEQP